MFITHVSWERFAGQADFKDGKPGNPLVHTTCGNTVIVLAEQRRSLWDGPGPCSGGGETVLVGELYCPKCDKKPKTKFGEGITPSEFFDPQEQAATA